MQVKVAVIGKDGQSVIGEYAVQADAAGPHARAEHIYEQARRAAVEDGKVGRDEAQLLSFRVVSE